MPRVLHLFNEYLPKTEVWAHQLIKACPDTDHFILADYYSNLNRFEQHVTLLNRQAGLTKMRRAKRSQYDFPFNLFEPLTIVKDIFTARKNISRAIEKHKIDVIHIHFGTTAIENWDDLKDIQIPILVSFYGWDYQKSIYYNPSYQLTYQSIFKKAHLLITEGHHGKDQLITMGAKAENIVTLPLGISISKALTPPKTFKPNGTLRLLQIASIAQKKGQLTTVKAFEKSLVQYPQQIELTLVGDDRDLYYATELRQYIKDAGLEETIHLQKWIDYDQISSFMQHFDVFIHPSMHADDGDCEGGSPVILLHAQSLGLAIISTQHCDIPEQVIHGETGFLAPEGDIERITEYINHFMTMNRITYFEMSKNCMTFVSDKFDVRKIGVKLKSYYVALLN